MINKLFLSVFIFVISSSLFASIPDCKTKSKILVINNQQVLNWKETSKDQFKSRAHIEGTIVNLYPDQTGHAHMSMQIGEASNDTIEVIYNEEFGKIPSNVQLGSHIEACGDYITARNPSGKYPASPDGAIIHWVQKSTRKNHDSGFIAIDSIVYGQ